MNTDDRAPFVIDQLSLTDSGAPDWKLVECVGPAGQRTYWLLDPDCEGGGPGPRIPEHEQLGPLPGLFPRRVRDALNRCRRMTATTGRPCQRHVAKPGDACRFHRTSDALGEAD